MEYKSYGDIIKFTEPDINCFKRLNEFIQYLEEEDEFDSRDPDSWTYSMWKKWTRQRKYESIRRHDEKILGHERNFVGPLITAKQFEHLRSEKLERERLENKEVERLEKSESKPTTEA